jgi:hypothetical protein
MKKVMLVAVVLLLAAPVFAQGPFTDVPTDHWAYDAVNQLQKDGLLIGYPDGTFAGKRTITRYEFAVALARLVNIIPTPEKGGISKADVEGMLGDYVKKSDLKEIPQNLATKADVDALKKLIDEFRDEIAALGVDVDALKRDMAALSARVDAIESEQRRVRFTGDVTVFGIAGGSNTGLAIDLDERELGNPQTGDVLARNISVVKDMDLKVVGRISESTTANAVINYGNYLNYLAWVDDYVDGPRATSKRPNPNVNPAVLVDGQDTLSDAFFPYYLYIDAGFGKGSLTVGRFPLQFTPYTLKMIDVDSYTNILKTSDGNYPVDGAKVAVNFGGVDMTLFAVKNDENDYLINGLTGQPNAGLYTVAGTFNEGTTSTAGSNAVGGLSQITQSAGLRFTLGTPFNGVLGGTYYQAWDGGNWSAGRNGYDQARVWGVDLSIPIPVWNTLQFLGSYTQSTTLGTDLAPSNFNIDNDNAAWDAKLGFAIGSVDAGVGYKDIGRNFTAAGAWDKIGRWTNPTDVTGPYAEFAYPFCPNLKVWLNGEWLRAKDDVIASGAGYAPAGAFVWMKGDEVWKAEAAVKWGFAKSTTLDASYQYVKWDPQDVALFGTSLESSKETYLTVGVGHQVNPSAKLNVGYQFITLNGNPLARPYYDNYRGGVGVVQLGVNF